MTQENLNHQPKKIFCPKCGTQLPSGCSFCAKCGTSINDVKSGLRKPTDKIALMRYEKTNKRLESFSNLFMIGAVLCLIGAAIFLLMALDGEASAFLGLIATISGFICGFANSILFSAIADIHKNSFENINN